MGIKVLLDTDIGTDIDDAVCLAYLLSNPDCNLMGITTVSGEAVKRAQMADALCRAAGQAVPIYPGAENPLLVPQIQTKAQQAIQLKNWEHETSFPPGRAVPFLAQTIRNNPREIILLSIGPMTNLALLFRMDPEIPSLLKGLVSMCGIFTNRTAGVGPQEWNALLDPHAAAIVYSSCLNFHRSIGLDVTVKVQMKIEEFRDRFQTPLLRVVEDFAQVFFQKAKTVIFHDPLAAATVFDPDICVFQKGLVEVEYTSPNEKVRGMTLWTPDVFLTEPEKARHEVALTVDSDRFFTHYFSVFS